DDSPSGGRDAGSPGAPGQVDAQGFLRGVLPRIREGNEPPPDGARRQDQLSEARARADRKPTEEADRSRSRRPVTCERGEGRTTRERQTQGGARGAAQGGGRTTSTPAPEHGRPLPQQGRGTRRGAPARGHAPRSLRNAPWAD